MKQFALMIGALAVVAISAQPVFANHSFWHQVKDQVYNSHGWQYGYGTYPAPRNYPGTTYGHSNPWGTYGYQQGWGHAQRDAHEYQEQYGSYHHD